MLNFFCMAFRSCISESMDITLLFKACVKTVKTRSRNVDDSDKNRILPKSRGNDPYNFQTRAKGVTCNITRLRDFLLQSSSDYLNTSSHLGFDDNIMTDADRDEIDAGAQEIIKRCSQHIKEIREESAKGRNKCTQSSEHKELVIEILEKYLKQVCRIYSELKAVRVKRTVDKKTLARFRYTSSTTDVSKKKNNGNNELGKVTPETPRKWTKQELEQDCPHVAAEDKLTADEIQMFETENQLMYNELNSLVDEVQQIEGKVMKIAELQEIFTEKVLEQEVDIDRISDTVVGTTENIKDANEQLREAIKNKAGFRVWVLFFLIVMSFSLLFLDWYND